MFKELHRQCQQDYGPILGTIVFVVGAVMVSAVMAVFLGTLPYVLLWASVW